MFAEKMFAAYSMVVEYHRSEAQLWHERMAHVNFETIWQMIEKDSVKDFLIKRITTSAMKICKGCQYGKHHKASYKTTAWKHRCITPGEFIHADLCGRIRAWEELNFSC